MSSFVPSGFGWQRCLPDGRDYTLKHPQIRPLLRLLKFRSGKPLPDAVDLRRDGDGEYFTSVDDQGSLNSSTAFAALAIVEYFERRIHGRTFDGSKLFLYQATRYRLAATAQPMSDCGSDLRSTLKVLTQIGVPQESYWPYLAENFTVQPSPFVFSNCRRLDKLRFLRLVPSGTCGDTTWETLKSFLAAGFPVLFGFSVPSSLTLDPNIPYRPDLDAPRGGQCVVAVGYRCNYLGRGNDAVLIRSSWGSQWGDHGNGWLPVEFVRSQLAQDFWTLICDDWLDSNELSCPSVIDVRVQKKV